MTKKIDNGTKSDFLATQASKLIEKVDNEIKTEIPPKPINIKIGKKAEVKYVKLADIDSNKEWTRLCLVQLDYSFNEQIPPEEFGFMLLNKDNIKNKVDKALNVAKKNNVDIICFPELSFDKEWVDGIRENCGEMIIIGGSYYTDGCNVCPIITKVDTYLYKKIDPSPFENHDAFDRGMEKGNEILIFQTKFGKFSVLTCSDFNPDLVPLVGRQNLNFIFNPCCEENPLIVQEYMNFICNYYEIDIIQVNKSPEKGLHGKSCIISKEHDNFLERSVRYKFTPDDHIKYKFLELGEERMVIVDLNIKTKGPALRTPAYAGRIKISPKNCYEYDNKKEDWCELAQLPLYGDE